MDIGFFDITLTKIVFGVLLVLIYTKLGMLLTNQHLYINNATNFYSSSDANINRMADRLASISGHMESINYKVYDSPHDDLMRELRSISAGIKEIENIIKKRGDVDLTTVEQKLDDMASSLSNIDSKTESPLGRDPDLPNWVG